MTQLFLLIKAETKRIILSLNYLSIIAVLVYIHMTRSYGWIPVFKLSYGYGFLDNNLLICVLISLSFSAYIIKEFKTRTIQNKIVLGYNNIELYLSSLIALILASASLVFLDMIFYFFDEFLRKEALSTTLVNGVTNTFIFICTISCIATMICSLCYLIRTKIAVLLCVIISIISLNTGRTHVATLTAYYSLFTEVNQEISDDETDLLENYTAKPSKELEMNLNRYICISPYEQCYFSTYLPFESYEEKIHHSYFVKNCRYHIDFIIIDGILLILLSLSTTSLLKKIDL